MTNSIMSIDKEILKTNLQKIIDSTVALKKRLLPILLLVNAK